MHIEELLTDTYRRTADFAAAYAMENPGCVRDFVNLSISDNHKMAMRASRVLNLVQEKEPELINPFLHEILKELRVLKDHSARRNLTKLFIGNTHMLEEENRLVLIDICFRQLNKTNTEKGTRAYSLEILYEISNSIPEIQSELLAVIELHYNTETAAFKSKADKIKANFRRKAFKTNE